MDTLDLKAIEGYKRYRLNPPTVWNMWPGILRPHLILVLGTACLGIYGLLVGKTTMGLFIAGVTTGVFLNDYLWLKRTERWWPTVERIIDWELVDKILEQPESVEP